MKKRLIFPLLTFASLLAFNCVENNNKAVNAAFDTKNAINEIFDDNDLSDSWDLIGNSSLNQQYSSMRLKPKVYDWGASLTLNKKISGDFKFKLDIKTMNEGGWFAVAFGSSSPSSPFSNSNGGIVFSLDHSETLKKSGEDFVVVDSFDSSIFSSDISKRRQGEFVIHEIDDEHSSMQVKIYENNIFIGELFPTPYIYNNLNGYISFNSSLKDVEIFNIELLDGDDKSIYYDDFSSSSILYPSSGSSDSEWYSNGFDEDELKVGFINYLSFNSVNDGIVYKQQLEKQNNPDLDIIYHIQAEIQYSAIDIGIESGFEIGKKDMNSHGYFFGLRRLAIGYSLVTYKNDEDDEFVLNNFDEDPHMMATLNLFIHNNGTVDFNIDDKLFHTVNSVSYHGYFGLFNYNHLNKGQGTKGASVFVIKMNKTNYYDRSSDDIFMNFNGTKKSYFEDTDEYAYDFFISRKEWNIGANVSLPKWTTKSGNNGKLEFNSSTSSSSFGPKVMFKDFVVKFDVEITSKVVPSGGVLGLEFGSSHSGLLYENSKSLGINYFRPKGENPVTLAFATNMDIQADDTVYCEDESGDKNIFDTHGKFTMMYICQNNVVSMHYLLEGEDESTLSKIRASAICRENESTNGYLFIYGANGISFSIDNLSIINLDYECKPTIYSGATDYQEVTRIDFNNKETVAGINYEKASLVNEGMMIEDNGYLRSEKLITDGVLRLNINELNDELIIRQGTLDIHLLNRINKEIIVKDLINDYHYKLDDFDFDQSIIEIQKLGTRLSIKYKDQKTPLASIYESEILFEIENTLSDYLTIESKGGNTNINGLTFINLNKYATIKARDYNPDTDLFEPWVEKPARNAETNSGSNMTLIIVLSSIGGTIVVGLIIFLTIFFIKRRKAHA